MAEPVSVEDFLYAVLRDDVEGFVDTALIGPGPDRPINRHKFWKWPEQVDKIVSWCEKHADEDLYFTPMLFENRSRERDAAIQTSVVWADTDEANPYSFDLDPSLVIETSPGRWQAYWCLAEDVEPWWAEEMSRRVTYSKLKDGSDNNGWYLGKLMRLPGGMNTKPALEKPHRVSVEVQGNVYTKADFEKVYGEAEKPSPLVMDERDLPEDLPDRVDVLERIPSNPKMERALNVPDRAGGRSEARWFVACELFRSGFSAEEVFVVIRGSANDKYTIDNRPMRDLWREILKAEQAAKLPGAIPPKNMVIRPEALTELSKRPVLLTDEERASLPRTFIDDYVAWAATKTNGDKGYHQFAAMCILSTVLGDFGYAVPSFGKLSLNLWFMILGETTRTYKTTAKRLMLRVLNKLENDEYTYDLGSDATSEGLLGELTEHPGRSVLLHRDEANSMLTDAKGGKHYMTGFGETLTELYDGTARGRLRASGAKKVKATDTTFNLFLLGVPEKLASVLTQEDFASGFLTRFMYVVGRPEDFTPENQRIEQMDLTAENVLDEDLVSFQNYFLKLRRFWGGNNGYAGARAVRCDDAAWERFNEFSLKLATIANTSTMPKVLEPCANRLNKMVLKLATLLAMSENKEEVSLPYMLTAIRYCEKWYQHLITVVRMVGLTEFASQVDALVASVVGGKRKYTEVRRQFKNLTQRQWTEILSAAQDQYLVRLEKEAKTDVVYIEVC